MWCFFIGTLFSAGLFARTFGGADWEDARSLVQTADGGYVLPGKTDGFGAGDYDFLVLKIDQSANLIWARSFGGADLDAALCASAAGDTCYAVVGHTSSFGAGYNDLLVLHLDGNGDLSWAKTFGGTGDDYAQSVAESPDGGCVIAGYTASFGAGNNDMLVLKLNQNGNLIWAKTFGGTGNDRAYSVAGSSDGGCVVAGCSSSFGAGGDDFLVLKLDGNGNTEWTRSFGGTGWDEAMSGIQAPDGGYVIAGYTTSFGAGQRDFLVLKLDENGNLIWARSFGGTGYDYGQSVSLSPDNGYVIAGYTTSFGAGSYDLLVLNLDGSGNLSWARSFGGAGYDYAYCVAGARDTGILVAGHTASFGSGGNDLLVLKLDENGDYPDCVVSCTPVVNAPSLSVSSPSLGASCTPVINTPGLTVDTPNLNISDVCSPVFGNTNENRSPASPVIRCSFGSGAVVFRASENAYITIYAPDGRLVRKLMLSPGENGVLLDRGVYFWKAGGQTGKAVVR